MNIYDTAKISKRITSIGNITIKHYVKLNTFDRSGHKQTYANMYNGMNSPTCYLSNTSDAIILESYISESERKDKQRSISVYLSYNDAIGIDTMFNEGYRWFNSDIKNDLFEYTKDGKPYKVNEKYRQLNYTINLKNTLLKGAFLCIQPAIITDMINTVTYPGVIFKCINGVLGTCTVEEFMNMRLVMRSLMNNLYQNSLLLINNTMLYNEK